MKSIPETSECYDAAVKLINEDGCTAIFANSYGHQTFMMTLIAWINRAVWFGTVIMFGSTGEIITERSGNLNLGVPGLMFLGGFAGFAGAYFYENSTANPSALLLVLIALLCAFLAAAAGGAIYSLLTITLRANQNVTGLALTTFGAGVANFFGVQVLNGGTSVKAAFANSVFTAKLPFLSGLGAVGSIFFSYGFMGTKYGVVKTQLSERSWTAWLEVPYITYITETEETP